MSNVCFICNLTKQEFTNNGLSFNKHTKDIHYIWNYVFCIIGLLEKDPNEYTGIESYISKKYELKENDWFPFQRTSMLKEREITEEEARDLRVSRIESKLDTLMELFKQKET